MNRGKTAQSVCITGLGAIGLPTAALLGTSGFTVWGVDTNLDLIERLRSGIFTSTEPGLQELATTAVQKGTLKLSTEPSSADTYLIAVPTPLGPANQPDLSHVDAAIAAIEPHLRSGDLLLIESTCPIGTTEAIASGLPDVHVAYCPERILPGNALHELVYNDRIVGGVDPASTERAVAFYQSFCQGEVLPTDSRTAEAVKLAENTYRDINIAFANELSMIADHTKIDVNSVIKLANRHPRVNILQPGVGVGGHCIAVDPWFLVAAAPDLAPLTVKAREVNTHKTNWVLDRIKKAIAEHRPRTVACLGLTYKPDVADLRESPALAIAEALEKEIEVLRVDPYIVDTVPLDHALVHADMILYLVPHRAFKNISFPSEGKTVLDFASGL